MHTLKERGFNVIALDSLVERIRQSQLLPPKAVVLTFDDGYQNFHDHAYPVLNECGFPATVFVIPRFSGTKSGWSGQIMGGSDLKLMGHGEITQLAREGIEFGSHTLRHPNLTTLPLSQAMQEIVESKSELEHLISREVRFFAYPFGAFDSNIRTAVSEVFLGACSTYMGFTDLRSDLYALPRIDMYYFSRNNLFSCFGNRLFSTYIVLRNAMRLARRSTGHLHGAASQ
jgi:peptidoglycan/xylan/chitin deacetylase (PgdA/CDA1 family)